MLSVKTKLAMAAAFNGSMLDGTLLTQGNLRNLIFWHMEDYFRHTPVEGSQFNSGEVLAELDALTYDGDGYSGLLKVMGEIGFRCEPNCESVGCRTYVLEAPLRERFIDEAVSPPRNAISEGTESTS